MDCASCAATVEKRVGQLPGVRRAVVNFAAGRLDAEHDPGLALEEIEKAVRDAGYGVERAQEIERLPFWRDRKSTRLNSSHANISHAVFCLINKTHSQLNYADAA